MQKLLYNLWSTSADQLSEKVTKTFFQILCDMSVIQNRMYAYIYPCNTDHPPPPA